MLGAVGVSRFFSKLWPSERKSRERKAVTEAQSSGLSANAALGPQNSCFRKMAQQGPSEKWEELHLEGDGRRRR